MKLPDTLYPSGIPATCILGWDGLVLQLLKMEISMLNWLIQFNEGLILETEENKLIPFDNQGGPQVGVVSHPNGKLYTIPGDGNILEIDPINKTSHQVYVSGSTSTNVFAGGSGGYALSAKYTFVQV